MLNINSKDMRYVHRETITRIQQKESSLGKNYWAVLACLPNRLNLVFPNEEGLPLNNSNMRRRHFEPALTEAGIGHIRFHDLRHTYASLLIKQGENIKYIQSQLGHSSPMVTLNTYTHLFESVNQEAACRLENTVFEKNGSKTVAKPEGT